MSSAEQARGIHDLPGWVRRTWLVPLVMGLVLALVGVLLLVNLNAGARVVQWLVVAALLLAALEAAATAPSRHGWLGRLAALLYVVGAVTTALWPDATLQTVTSTAGAVLLVAGGVQGATAWRARRAARRGWLWSFVPAVLAVVAGVVLLIGSPSISVVLLTVGLACYLIFSGGTLVALSSAVRKASSATARHAG